MTARVRAIVKPELLLWARESIALPLDVAARKIGVSPARLTQWEAGELSPTVNQLRNAARVYKRPLAVFYLPEPPRTFYTIRDFRRLPHEMLTKHSPELNYEIRYAHMRREIALELSNQIGHEQLRIDFEGPTDDPESFAKEIRDFLGIPLDEQFGWKDQYEALNSWIAAIESKGILVFQTSDVGLDEMRGFSISEPMVPVMVVNANDSPRGRIFTLIHELAHILLDMGGLCDLRVFGDVVTENHRIEVFCNQVAGSFLVPTSEFLDEPIVQSGRRMDEWTDEDLRSLAERYSVSSEVILRRLVTLGRASRDFYERTREEFLKAYRQISETRPGGFLTPDRAAIRNLGRSYIRLVLQAYYQEVINSSNLSDFLGLRLKHLPKIEARVLGSP